MDNRVFNINGYGDSFLKTVITLAFEQYLCDSIAVDCRCRGWSFEKKHGLLLHSYVDESSSNDINKLPSLTAENVFPLVQSWLDSDEAKNIKYDEDNGMDHDPEDYDISVRSGWRVYVDTWGRVAGRDVICAIIPSYLWYGK